MTEPSQAMTVHALQVVDQQVAGDLLRLAHGACSCGWAGPVRGSADPHQAELLDDDLVWHLHEQGEPCSHAGCLTCYPEPTEVDAELAAWLAAQKPNLDNLRGSAVFLQLFAGEDPDPGMALALGYAILLGKPLVFIVRPGDSIPDGLVRAADALIEWTDDQAELNRRLGEALGPLLGPDTAGNPAAGEGSE